MILRYSDRMAVVCRNIDSSLHGEMNVSFYLSVVVLSVVFFLFVLSLFVSMCVEYASDVRQRRERELQRRQQLLSCSC